MVRSAWLASAAAAVILLVFGIRYFNRQPVNDTPQVIQTDEQPFAKLPSKPTEQPRVKSAETKKADPGTVQKGIESDNWRIESTGQARASSFRMEQNKAMALIIIEKEELTAVNLSTYNLVPAGLEPEKGEKQQILAKAFGKMIFKARNSVSGNPNLDKIRDSEVDFWSIAEAGVKGFSTVTDRDLELKVRRDEDGNIRSYALVEDDHLIITKSRD